MKRIFTIVFVCLSMLAASHAAALTGIHLERNDTLIYVGQPLQLHYTLDPADAEYESVTFSSSDPTKVPVDATTGVVSAFNVAYAVITVTATPKNSGDPTAGPGPDVYTDKCNVYVQYRAQGQAGNNLFYTIDYDYQLVFWADDYEKSKPTTATLTPGTYNMYDYAAPGDMGASPAPWYAYHDQITDINLSNVERVGNNAFRDMTKLGYVILYEGQGLSDSVFVGCTNLTTVEVRDTTVTPISWLSLWTDRNGGQVSIVIVQDQTLLPQFENDPKWNNGMRIFTASDGRWGSKNEVGWALSRSDSLGSLQLKVERYWESTEEAASIPDMDTASIRPPWHALRDKVENLVIGDRMSYIGKNAFASLTNIQTVQFHHNVWSLDSMHYDAFAHTITPWKFAFGDPDDGPYMPPKVVGLPADGAGNFGIQTVLWVPDGLVEYLGTIMKVVDAYKAAPFWKDFKRVDDRTVANKTIGNKAAVLTWLPLENAEGYRLTIHKEGCATCDTTVFIPALGGKGLIDWANNVLPTYIVPSSVAPRRMPQGDDGGGGMTIVIEIGEGCGSAPHKDVELTASSLEPETKYSFEREVVMKAGAVNPAYTKGGEFITKEGAPSGVEVVSGEMLRTPAVYDLTGRCVGTDITGLPEGIYILDNGCTRTKILLRR